MWTDGEYDYDFGTPDWLNWYQIFWFKGTIRQYKLGFNKKYLAYKKHLYIKGKEHLKESLKRYKEEQAKLKLAKRSLQAQKNYSKEYRNFISEL